MSGTFSEGNELKEVVTFSNGNYFSVFKFVYVEYKEFGGLFFFNLFGNLYVFFSYCSWGSQGKNTGVVCHSLFTGRTDAAAEAPILRSLDAKS